MKFTVIHPSVSVRVDFFQQMSSGLSRLDFARAKPVFFIDRKVWKIAALRKELSKYKPDIILLDSGESLKTLKNVTKVLTQLDRRYASHPAPALVFVAVGGGSITDFVGFVASVFKRGVKLVLIPSTWLSAIDSAHGGKNGVNGGSAKNQIGTVYQPSRVLLMRELLLTEPDVNLISALGEVIKMGIILGGKMFKKVQAIQGMRALDDRLLWQMLPALVNAKMGFVVTDPLEKRGVRRFLNLGHTVGHGIEVLQRWPHGVSVYAGIRFVLELSEHLGVLDLTAKPKIINALNVIPIYFKKPRHSVAAWQRILLQDKKRQQGHAIEMILINRPGKLVLQSVPLSDVLRCLKKLDWVK